jgi:RecA-family ATPase
MTDHVAEALKDLEKNQHRRACVQQSKVLIVSLEDDADELRRRILAQCLHHNISRPELKGWLFLSAPGAAAGKLMSTDKTGRFIRGAMADNLEAVITGRGIDLVALDPFGKSHSVEENGNSAIDEVVQVLTDLCAKHDISVDAPHHTSKGVAEPGNANRGRGASSMKDAARLVYTLTPMNAEEEQTFGVKEEERRLLIRMDSGKVNITPSMRAAKWFRLVGVPLGNGTERPPKWRRGPGCRAMDSARYLGRSGQRSAEPYSHGH